MPNKTLILIGVGVGLVLVLAAAWAAKRGVAAAGAAVNPLNAENIFNQGMTGIVSQLTGREETLGGWLAELFDPATRRANEMLNTPPFHAPVNDAWL